MSTAMSLPAGLASDLAAIAPLAYAIYFRRYHRRDLLLAYVALNRGGRPLPNSPPPPRAGGGFGPPTRASIVTAPSRASAVVPPRWPACRRRRWPR